MLRVRERDVVVLVPRTSHLAIGDFAAKEPFCLARGLLRLLARARLPPMDIWPLNFHSKFWHLQFEFATAKIPTSSKNM